MPAGPSPMPPGDFASRTLPVSDFAPGDILFRIHRDDGRDPLHFGRAKLAHQRARFHGPRGQYGVCYLGVKPETAFVETLLRYPGGQLVSMSDLAARKLARVEVTRDLRVADLTGPGLVLIGGTAEISSTRDYTLSWAWSRAVYEHPDGADGILYRCRHDDDQLAVALFGRARTAVRVQDSKPLIGDLRWLGELAGRYKFGLAP